MSTHVLERLRERYWMACDDSDLAAISAMIRDGDPRVMLLRRDEGACLWAVRFRRTWVGIIARDDGFLITAKPRWHVRRHRRELAARLEMLCRSGREPVPARQ